MARVLFVTWQGGGNVTSVVEVGRQLGTLGHDVHVLGSASLRVRLKAADVAFTPREAASEWEDARLVDDICDVVDDVRPDLVVADYMMPAALCAVEQMNLPTAVLVHTFFGALLEDGTPSPMKMASSVRGVNALRRQLGLAPVDRLGDLLERAERVVVTVPESLDVPPRPRPANLVYVGPVFEPAGADAGWQPPPGEGPLIVVTLGTTDMDELPVLLGVLDALAHERARVFATIGDHVDPASIPTHANATISPFVQHAAVLPQADLVVSHAGIGTALATVAYGLPALFLPLGRDQPTNARAIARAGAAKVLLPASVTPAQIARAAEELLVDPSYAAAARRLGEIMPPLEGIHPATELLDELARSAAS